MQCNNMRKAKTDRKKKIIALFTTENFLLYPLQKLIFMNFSLKSEINHVLYQCVHSILDANCILQIIAFGVVESATTIS